jgi:hypothetical protein
MSKSKMVLSTPGKSGCTNCEEHKNNGGSWIRQGKRIIVLLGGEGMQQEFEDEPIAAEGQLASRSPLLAHSPRDRSVPYGTAARSTIGLRTAVAEHEELGGAPTDPLRFSFPGGTHLPAANVRMNAWLQAQAEFRRWRQHGAALSETDERTRSILKDYWMGGTGLSSAAADHAIRNRTPWSAAFISWIMRKAGAGNAFAYNAAHGPYIRAARENRYAGNANPFKAFRISEASPRLGDIVCNSRNATLNFDRIDGPGYHCDVVVKRRASEIDVIGGNVSDSVGQKTLRLDAQGRIDESRHGRHVAVISIG